MAVVVSLRAWSFRNHRRHVAVDQVERTRQRGAISWRGGLRLEAFDWLVVLLGIACLGRGLLSRTLHVLQCMSTGRAYLQTRRVQYWEVCGRQARKHATP